MRWHLHYERVPVFYYLGPSKSDSFVGDVVSDYVETSFGYLDMIS
jgi:hypothetical protein